MKILEYTIDSKTLDSLHYKEHDDVQIEVSMAKLLGFYEMRSL